MAVPLAANAAVDRLRREALRTGEPLDAALPDGEGRRIDRVPADTIAPDREGDGHLFLEDLVAALSDLRGRQRDAVLLRHQQGLTYAEIALALGVREGTAKTLVHRGLARLRERLEPWDPGAAGRGD